MARMGDERAVDFKGIEAPKATDKMINMIEAGELEREAVEGNSKAKHQCVLNELSQVPAFLSREAAATKEQEGLDGFEKEGEAKSDYIKAELNEDKSEVDEALKATDKMIEMTAMADPKLVKVAADAHHTTFG
eukprot:15465216-Alexandrium_andersonii.AAC.1